MSPEIDGISEMLKYGDKITIEWQTSCMLCVTKWEVLLDWGQATVAHFHKEKCGKNECKKIEGSRRSQASARKCLKIIKSLPDLNIMINLWKFHHFTNIMARGLFTNRINRKQPTSHEDITSTNIVGKGNYRVICSLSILGKVHRQILTKRIWNRNFVRRFMQV